MPQYLIRVFFLLVLIVGHGDISASNQDSKVKIKEKVAHYLANVFGGKPPTLADYYRYENKSSNLEGLEEDKFCVARWGGIQTKGCKGWLVTRYKDLKKAKSLFYERVRKLVQLKPKQDHTTKVVCDESKSGDYCEIEVRYMSKGTSLSLKLVNDPRIPDLAYLKVSKIDGKPIEQYFQ